ncbi:SpaH/EbpB family LPXTG-anchored major pilin [Corynebacterium lizhenjunii]|uniref:SpaH/EbpB family LPXTG-anchored major pilin n=1 Tax=Corynebacterium lizhenjunii TaxID=2709394 RepID=A0A7T0KFP9_9CORY|nr:SpaH/EbpB family LPXTG-anchored major pilin [Corynebacterium lizhenjunii]QPK79511.1 SpaH/EbpB family LPXTG-anchored major pilin [Corynebacterium lizhenjunii]
MNIFTKSLTAAVASGVLVGGAGAFAPVAFAQDTPAAPAANVAQPVGSLDSLPKDGEVSLTVHKFSNNNPGAAGDGTQRESTEGLGDALPGAEFQIQRVTNVDLKTQAGWLAAEKLAKGAEDAITPELGAAVKQTTNDRGIANFASQNVGLYLVTETAAPAGHSITTAPFYVALPMTNPDGNGWLRDVHVYPKNSKQSDFGTKTVNDQATRVNGNEITYTIAQDVQQRARTAPARKYFQINDQYPTERLEYKDVNIAGYVKNFHYVVQDQGANGLKIVFTQNGLKALDIASRAGAAKIEAQVTFTVKDAAGEGANDALENKYTYTEQFESTPPTPPENPNQPETPPTPPETPPTEPPTDVPQEPTPEEVPPVTPPETPENPFQWPKSYFGQVDITKTNTNDDVLTGAIFDLYTCNANAELGQTALRTGIEAKEGVEINQLRVNDWQNNAAVDARDSFYCLVETKAPAGYELNAQPIRFQVLKGEQEANIALTSVEVKDVRRNAGFQLPLTGGQGIMFLILAGGAVLILGRGYAIYSQRRAN